MILIILIRQFINNINSLLLQASQKFYNHYQMIQLNQTYLQDKQPQDQTVIIKPTIIKLISKSTSWTKYSIIVTWMYFFQYFLLAGQLIYLPIQLVFYSLVKGNQNLNAQFAMDFICIFIFCIDIWLYCDQKYRENKIIQLQTRQTYSNNQISYFKEKRTFRMLISVEFMYDIFVLVIAIAEPYLLKDNLQSRAIMMIFFFKVFVLAQYDQKCNLTIINSRIEFLYRLIRTIVFILLGVAYLGCLFYGIAVIIDYYNIGNQYAIEFLWINSFQVEGNDFLTMSPAVQFMYTMEWALVTYATATYGNISPVNPIEVAICIWCMFFASIVYGYYTNSMYSIPLDISQVDQQILLKFDTINKHDKSSRMDPLLKLQIMASIQYRQSKRNIQKEMKKVVTSSYLKQVKFSINSIFFESSIMSYIVGFGNKQFVFDVSENLQTIIFQKDDNVFAQVTTRSKKAQDNRFRVSSTDLLMINQGVVKLQLQHNSYMNHFQLASQFSSSHTDQLVFNVFSFVTGLLFKQSCRCLSYTSLTVLSRNKYIQCVRQSKTLYFNKLFMNLIQNNKPRNSSRVKPIYQPVPKFRQIMSQTYEKLKRQILFNKVESKRNNQITRTHLKSTKKLMKVREKISIALQTEMIPQMMNFQLDTIWNEQNQILL